MIPVILSGGSGSRLWPLSRKAFPKQFLALTAEQTLFQQTIERLAFDGMQPPLLVCNQEHRFIVKEQLAARKLAIQGLMLEPFGRNTAPAIAIAAMKLLDDGRDELLLVLPADHVIEDHKAFQRSLAWATNAAENGEMVLFGIPATSPETGYGYIKCDHSERNGLPEGVNRVTNFVEKPDEARAQQYVESGDYYWNSGMFLFRASVFLEELKKHDPDIYDTCWVALERSAKNGEEVLIDPATFACCPDNSIDYAVMEHCEHAAVVPLAAAWSDIGSFDALWATVEPDAAGNASKGDAWLTDTHDSLVFAEHRLVATLGVQNLIVVETSDSVLVARRDQAQQVKQLVASLSKAGRSEPCSAPQVQRPWGSFQAMDSGERYQVKHITVKPGGRLSLQRHHHRAEHWIVVRGTARVTLEERSFLVSENQSTYIPIGALHRLENTGKIPLELIEVQSGSYLGEDDIVRFEDVYGRCQ